MEAHSLSSPRLGSYAPCFERTWLYFQQEQSFPDEVSPWQLRAPQGTQGQEESHMPTISSCCGEPQCFPLISAYLLNKSGTFCRFIWSLPANPHPTWSALYVAMLAAGLCCVWCGIWGIETLPLILLQNNPVILFIGLPTVDIILSPGINQRGQYILSQQESKPKPSNIKHSKLVYNLNRNI